MEQMYNLGSFPHSVFLGFVVVAVAVVIFQGFVLFCFLFICFLFFFLLSEKLNNSCCIQCSSVYISFAKNINSALHVL